MEFPDDSLPIHSSMDHDQSLGVSSKPGENEIHDHVKSTEISSNNGENKVHDHAQMLQVSSTTNDNKIHDHSGSSEVSSNSDETVAHHHAESPVVPSNTDENKVHETVKSLTEKLSVAFLDINAKEDLIKQQSKVAEEAISGWEKAESEVAILKQQFAATAKKNSMLEDRISHLDGALKECVRQLRQAREEQEQKVHDVVTKNTEVWESNKSKLENQIIELKKQLGASEAEVKRILAENLHSKIGAVEKENVVLKAKLVSKSEELKIRMLERELSIQTAETASKQHLESIKKVAKLEAECRKLRAAARKAPSVNDPKTISSCVDSLTDSQSDSGDRFLGLDNEPSCSDSWASALIAELDQFRNEKAGTKAIASSVDIGLMDDFLEMEKLVAMPEVDNSSCNFGIETDSERVTETSSSKLEDEIVKQKMADLEEKVGNLESLKVDMEVTLSNCLNQLQISCNQLNACEGKVTQLQNELEMALELKQASVTEAVHVDAKREALESQLESALLEEGKLQTKVAILEGNAQDSALFLEKFKSKVSEATIEAAESQIQLAFAEVDNLRENMEILEGSIEEKQAVSAEVAAVQSQLLPADLEVRKLRERVNFLELRIEDEKSLSKEFICKVEAMDGERKALEDELQSALLKVQKLSDKVGLLQEEVDKERVLSSQLAAKCQGLEDEISRNRREAELQIVSCSNEELTVIQEKELAMATEKLAECQKTIASLGRQLKSLNTADNTCAESEQIEPNGGPPKS